MNLTHLSQPIKFKVPKDSKLIDLIVKGQGVFIFSNQDTTENAVFKIYNSLRTDGLIVQFSTYGIQVKRISNNQYYSDPLCERALTDKRGAYYWFSIDAQNKRLLAGLGEARLETIFYSHNLIDNDAKYFLESLDVITIDENQQIIPLVLLRDPITSRTPLYIKNKNELTMEDIALTRYMPIANLNNICQKLYNCISGPQFILDTPDFPDFSQAIEYSIATPGCWCYNKLQEKAREFNPDKPNINETYIRITLGENNGDSPGVPYVMEIWPKGHYSPIHNHAFSNAIIRVLHGEINVKLYPFLCQEKEENYIAPFGVSNFKKDEVTWITANLNQIHQLKNISTETTCITIQCYMYNNEDTKHYDYFDYITDGGDKAEYEPDRDMGFIEFKEKMRKEWNNRDLPKVNPKKKRARKI